MPVSKSYYPLMDVSRFAAAIGIVWIHVAGDDRLAWTKEFGRFAVPFFACSAVYLALTAFRRHPEMPVGQYAVLRFKRIYLPFLVWSVFYWAVRSLSSFYVEHTGFFKPSVIDFFWNGVAIQLWFLPFILLATIASFLFVKSIRQVPALHVPCMFVFAVAAVSLAIMPAPEFIRHGGYTVGLGYEILPCCCAVMAFGLGENCLAGKEKSEGKVSLVKLVMGIVLVAFWLGTALVYRRSVALENVAGFGLMLISLSWGMGATVAWIVALGSTSFGIYLIHPLFVEGMQHILPKIGFRGHSCALEISIFLTSFVASFVTVAILRRYALTKWLTG
jgi:peptidoglycan/LPS O-acetylase OafA/YrhL